MIPHSNNSQSIYVGYPNIAQSDIKSTSVTVDGISLTDPTVNSFVFGLNSTLRPTTNYRPDLYSFNMTLALAGAASPFITVEVPQLHITKPTSLNISNQRVTIESQSAWQDFLVAAFANETYGIHSQGKPNLKLGALPTDSVTFDKTIYVPGLNGLRNITTTNIKINTTSTTNNFNANVTIINPSNSDFTIGDVTYKNYIMPNMTYIGDSFIPNLVLRPGNNTVPTNASVQNGPVIDALGERPACATGMVETILVPSNVTYNGVELPYYLKSLANVTQLLPLGQAIESATMGLAKYYCK